MIQIIKFSCWEPKVFIQPKRNKCKKRIHIAKENETLYEISQYYGIKMKKLQKKKFIFYRNPIKKWR